ncbi:hypothetical protein WG909_14705 [Peptostreptococcaceae bacterium AGR-M142]
MLLIIFLFINFFSLFYSFIDIVKPEFEFLFKIVKNNNDYNFLIKKHRKISNSENNYVKLEKENIFQKKYLKKEDNIGDKFFLYEKYIKFFEYDIKDRLIYYINTIKLKFYIYFFFIFYTMHIIYFYVPNKRRIYLFCSFITPLIWIINSLSPLLFRI